MMGDMMPGMMPDMMGGMQDMMGRMGDMGPKMPRGIISNITCIMQEMQWMDDYGFPNPEHLMNTVENMTLNPFLTMSMNQEIAKCHSKSMCSMDNMDSPFGPKLTQMMDYAKCIGYGFFKSCAMSEMMMKLPSGPITEEIKAATMADRAAYQPDEEEMKKEGAFMNIIMTMFGPMSPFMQ